MFFTNLLLLMMHGQAEKPTVHEKWAWEISWNIECDVLSQPGCWWEWWKLLSCRNSSRINTRVTRYWTQQTTMSGMMHMGSACSQSSRVCCCFRILQVLHLGELWCYYGPLLSHALADLLCSSLVLFASWSPVKGIFNLISFGKEEKQDW